MGGSYLRVQLDSGACSLTTIGAVAAYQLAFWKDQSKGIVTNDKNQCDCGAAGAINRVAGVFQNAVTALPGQNGRDGQPLMYMCDLVIQKRNSPVLVASTALIGAQVTANTAANHADVVFTTGVNTAPVSQVLGVFTSTTVGAPGPAGTAPVNVSIGFTEV
jgi:hypothetical protein